MAKPGYATAWASPELDVGMLWRFAVFARDIILSAVAMHWLWHNKADKWNIGRSGLCCAGHSHPAMIKHGLAVTALPGRAVAWGLFDHWLPVWGTVGMEAHHELIQ